MGGGIIRLTSPISKSARGPKHCSDYKLGWHHSHCQTYKRTKNNDNLTVPYCPSCLPPTSTQKDPRFSTSSSSCVELPRCLCLSFEVCSKTLLSAPSPSPLGRMTGTSGLTTLQQLVQNNQFTAATMTTTTTTHHHHHHHIAQVDYCIALCWLVSTKCQQ